MLDVNSRRYWLTLALGLLGGSGSALGAEANERRLRLLVPFAPGGAGDAAARALAENFSRGRVWKTVVENRPGATGIVGAQAAFRGPPDGSFLFLGHSDTIVLNPLTRKALPYDASRFEPVAFVGRVPGVLLSRAASGIDSGFTLIKAARARPRQLTYASWGLGSAAHLGMEWLQQVGAIELLHVPYQSTAAAIQALLAGEIDFAFATPEFGLQAMSQGKALIVGASSATRIASAPAVPSLSEEGFPGFDLDTWYGLFAPPGTPAPVKNELHEAVEAAMNGPQLAATLRRAGHELQSMSIPEFGAFVEADRRRWRTLIETRRLAFEL